MIPSAVPVKAVLNKAAPASHTLVATKAKDAAEWEKWSQNVDVPIDEVKAITLHVSPTYDLDHVESVTLKSFRKIVGYDTFNSIRKGDRDEKKDTSDYYNVTVSMMIRRIPEDVAHPPVTDPYNGGVPLAQTLDKGFPYDDGDNTTDDQTPNWRRGSKPAQAQLVGKLNGENITKGALVNLIRDTDAPITQSLVQLDTEGMKADSDNVSTLFDSNVTRGNLKNLVTDKPAPITVALAQTTPVVATPVAAKAGALVQTKAKGDNGSAVFTLMDQNVTKGQMVNLITDKPSPITVALMQKQRAAALAQQGASKAGVFNLAQQLQKVEKKGVPVIVNPVIMKNTEGETDLGLKMLVGPDEVSVAKKNAAKAKKVATFAEIESSDDESSEE